MRAQAIDLHNICHLIDVQVLKMKESALHTGGGEDQNEEEDKAD